MTNQLSAAEIEKQLKKLQAQMARQESILKAQLIEAKAKEDALASLRQDLTTFATERGLTFDEIKAVLNGEVKKPRKTPVRHSFTNPANPNEVYSGSGKKRDWLKKLMADAGTDDYQEFLAMVQPKAEDAK